MSNRIGLAIVNAYVTLPSIAHFYSRTKEELAALDIDLKQMSNADIHSYIDSDGALVAKDLKADFVLYLDKDPYIADMLELNGYRLFNSARSIALCDDKMRTYLALSGQGIALPKTISAPLNYANEDHSSFLNHVQEELTFPIVAKTNFGSMGKGVFLAHNAEELRVVESRIAGQPRLYQEFIASSFGRDFRLIVIDGHFVCGYQRKSMNGEFRSNIAQGGMGEAVVCNAEQIAVAEKAARILGLDYCGVDLLEGSDSRHPVLCEVNSNAFIEGAEKTTGVNIAEKYAKYIAKSVYFLDF